MDAYHYHPRTKEFIHARPVRADPIEGNPMVPSNATLIAPPNKESGKVCCFIDGEWIQVEDHRGETRYNGREAILISALGVIPDALSEQPAQETDEEKLAALRYERDSRLRLTDWTMLTDSPLSDLKRSEFVAYRQALRDLPAATQDFDNINWPEEPVYS